MAGGRKTAKVNKERYGEDYYKVLGAKGGKSTHPNKGMAADPVLASKAGKKGGQRSRKGHKFISETATHRKYLRKSDGAIVEHKR